MIRYRVSFDTGGHHEVQAATWHAAVEAASQLEDAAGTRRDRRVTGLSYFRPDIGQWVSGDDLLSPDADPFPVTCGNGCPNGFLGRHKFSCVRARSAR